MCKNLQWLRIRWELNRKNKLKKQYQNPEIAKQYFHFTTFLLTVLSLNTEIQKEINLKDTKFTVML